MIRRTAQRLAEHAKTHALPSVSVILHGGEPLLAGPARLRRVCEEFGSALSGIAELDLRIHTNGVQLGSRYLDLFDAFGVRVGISLDGDRAANDLHRRYADGRSSHPLVLRAVELLHQERYRHLDLGLLCTIDVRNDPRAVVDALIDLEPPLIDFLLPHATWDEPPLRPDGSPTAYAEWILAVFDRWQERGRPVPVRLFSSLFSTLRGGPSLTESLGLAPTDLVVVETDGSLEQVDSLKSAYEGAAATGFDVFTHSFDDVAAHPGVRARQLGLAGVNEACRTCPVVRSCGGGLYTHRYRTENEFDNPSVYCADLLALVRGVEDRAGAVLTSPAIQGPEALADTQQDLTRALLARLNADLDGRAGEPWAAAWELAGEVEASKEGAEALDRVLAHPYARDWLQETLEGLHTGRAGGADRAAGEAWRLSAYVAAAAVRSGLDRTVPAAYRDGVLFLPTLGQVRVGGPGERGTALVRPVDGGFLVRARGGPERLIVRERAETGWLPVRYVAPDRRTGWAVDDLDPYRDRHGTPAAARLDDAAAEAFAHTVRRAWAHLVRVAPEQCDTVRRTLTTLTPLAAPGAGSGAADAVRARRPRGRGALGLPVHGDPEPVAAGLVRGARAAVLAGLRDVTDLYASDGAWQYRSPYDGESVPFSRLLADTHERVGLIPFRADFLSGVEEALELMDRAAEPTVDGKRLLDMIRKEVTGTARRKVGRKESGELFDQESS